MNKTTQQLQAEIEANKTELARRTAVEAAFKVGAIIEGTHLGEEKWAICDPPAFNWHVNDFRVKPEPVKPRIGFFSVERGCMGGAFGYLRFDEKEASRGYGYESKFVELTPEVRAALEEKKLL